MSLWWIWVIGWMEGHWLNGAIDEWAHWLNGTSKMGHWWMNLSKVGHWWIGVINECCHWLNESLVDVVLSFQMFCIFCGQAVQDQHRKFLSQRTNSMGFFYLENCQIENRVPSHARNNGSACGWYEIIKYLLWLNLKKSQMLKRDYVNM